MPPTITDSDCVGCGACIPDCPGNVLELIDGLATVVRADDCVVCGMCEDACPTGAIRL